MRVSSFGLIAALLAPCACTPPSSRTPASARLELPIHAGGGHVVHEVHIGGDGPFWSILDTGNRQTIVFERVAERLGLETRPHGAIGGAGTGSVPVRVARDVRVSLRGDGDEVTFVEPYVLVLPDAATMPEFEGRRIDVFLGTTLIERQPTSIDYAAGRLVLHGDDSFRAGPEARVLDLGMEQGFPFVDGSVTAICNGREVGPFEGRYHLDLGAAYAVQLDHDVAQPAGLLADGVAERRVDGQIMGIDGEMMDLLSLPAARVSLGGEPFDIARIQLVPVQGGGPPIEGLIGTVGSGVLRGAVVTLDYPGRRMIVER